MQTENRLVKQAGVRDEWRTTVNEFLWDKNVLKIDNGDVQPANKLKATELYTLKR